MEYKIIRTKGRRLKLYVEKDCTVVVKAPARARKADIEKFVLANIRWIEERKREHSRRAAMGTAPTPREIKILKKQAADVMGRKTEHFAAVMGVKPDGIKITSAKKRWGSCTRKGNSYTICYSYRNMFLSDRCRDYIAVHELAHIKHMNHSKAFYAEIEKILPDYRQLIKEIAGYPDYDLYPAADM